MVAVNLRAAVSSVGPVLADIIREGGLTAGWASLLTSLPTLGFAFASPASPLLARRLGAERAVLVALGGLTAGLLLRGTGGAAGLFIGQALAAVGIGVINVLLPGIVKRDFSTRIALMTGLYSMAFCVGAACAAAATVPLAERLGGWGAGLAVWAAPAALAALVWWVCRPAERAAGPSRAYAVRGLWTDRLAWQVTVFMGMQSALAYTVFGWLAPILRDRGLGAVEAGLLLSVSVVAQAAGSLVGPALATRRASQSLANVLAMVAGMVGLLGCLYGPLSAVWLFAVVLGLAQGALIAIGLTIIALRAPDPLLAAHLSSMAQTVGYLLASAGPLVAGLLHGWTGGWGAVAFFSCVLGLVGCLAGLGAGRPRHIGARAIPLGLPEDDHAPPRGPVRAGRA